MSSHVPLPSNSTATNQPSSRKSSSHNTPHHCCVRSTTYCAVLCSPAKTLTRHRPASTCAPAPLLGRRRAVLLHVALLAPSTTHMHAATEPRKATTAHLKLGKGCSKAWWSSSTSFAVHCGHVLSSLGLSQARFAVIGQQHNAISLKAYAVQLAKALNNGPAWSAVRTVLRLDPSSACICHVAGRLRAMHAGPLSAVPTPSSIGLTQLHNS